MKRKLLHKRFKCDTMRTKEKLKNCWYTKVKTEGLLSIQYILHKQTYEMERSKKSSVGMQKVSNRYFTLLTACFLVYPTCFGRVNRIMHDLS